MKNRATLKLYGWENEILGKENRREIRFGKGCTIKELLGTHDISLEGIGFITVNGEFVSVSYVLQDGDDLKIYPVIVGG